MELPFKMFHRGTICSQKTELVVYIQYQYTSFKRTLLNTRIEIPPAFLEL